LVLKETSVGVTGSRVDTVGTDVGIAPHLDPVEVPLGSKSKRVSPLAASTILFDGDGPQVAQVTAANKDEVPITIFHLFGPAGIDGGRCVAEVAVQGEGNVGVGSGPRPRCSLDLQAVSLSGAGDHATAGTENGEGVIGSRGEVGAAIVRNDQSQGIQR